MNHKDSFYFLLNYAFSILNTLLEPTASFNNYIIGFIATSPIESKTQLFFPITTQQASSKVQLNLLLLEQVWT